MENAIGQCNLVETISPAVREAHEKLLGANKGGKKMLLIETGSAASVASAQRAGSSSSSSAVEAPKVDPCKDVKEATAAVQVDLKAKMAVLKECASQSAEDRAWTGGVIPSYADSFGFFGGNNGRR